MVVEAASSVEKCAKEILGEVDNIGKAANTIVDHSTKLAEVSEQMKNEIQGFIDEQRELLNNFLKQQKIT